MYISPMRKDVLNGKIQGIELHCYLCKIPICSNARCYLVCVLFVVVVVVVVFVVVSGGVFFVCF